MGNSMSFNQLATILADVAGVERKEQGDAIEQDINDLIGIIKSIVINAENQKLKFQEYREVVERLLEALGYKLPGAVIALIHKIKNFVF